MNTKEVADRERSGRLVLLAGETHGEATAKAMAERYKRHMRRGEEKPDLGFVITLAGRRLAAAVDTMVAADEAHERELGDDSEPRAARDAAFKELYKLTVDVRDQVASVLGDAGIERLGMKEPAPSNPDRLVGYVRDVAKRLGDDKVLLPTPRRRTATLDRAAMHEELSAALTPLVAALGDVKREAREAEATLVTKQQAIAEYDAAFGETAGLYEALFRAAGMAELADRVRPSRRTPGRTVTDERGGEPTPGSPT